MMEATQALANLGDPGDTVAEGAQEAVEQASLAERAAQASAATCFNMIERMRSYDVRLHGLHSITIIIIIMIM